MLSRMDMSKFAFVCLFFFFGFFLKKIAFRILAFNMFFFKILS